MNLGLRELLRMGDVKRWHTVATAREQTLADHSCRVALIALRLYWHLTGEGANADVARLLTTALLHDAAEVHLGDPPPAGKTVMYMSEEAAMMRELPPPFTAFMVRSTELKNIIKVADRIEAFLWIRENAVGDHSKAVIRRCLDELERVASEYGMTDQANSVINEVIKEGAKLCPF